MSVSAVRVNVGIRVSIEPTYSLNSVTLHNGGFTTTLAGLRVTYTVTPLVFVSVLVQYNSSTSAASTNARLRWEYRPGSELFVVYNDERDTAASLVPALRNRAVIVKVNRLLRF